MYLSVVGSVLQISKQWVSTVYWIVVVNCMKSKWEFMWEVLVWTFFKIELVHGRLKEGRVRPVLIISCISSKIYSI